MIKKGRFFRIGMFVTTDKGESIRRRSIPAFLLALRACPHSGRYDLVVTYATGITNSGTYLTRNDLLKAAKAFTNSDELKFIRDYWKTI